MNIKVSKSYSLRLSDGQGWRILATPETLSFIDQFASIFSLNDDAGPLTNLIFTRHSPADHLPIYLKDDMHLIPSLDGLPVDGWTSKKIRSVEVWHHNDVPDVLCNIGPEVSFEQELMNLSFSMYPIYQRAINCGGLPFHSALVERDGKSVILAARGDTGKSTCARRIPPPWKSLCDDEALAVKTGETRYEVHPFPTWSNFIFDRPQRSWDVQHHAKLSGIFFIEQGQADEAIPLGQGEAAMRIYSASLQVMGRMIHSLSSQDQVSLKKQLFSNACEISKAMPCYSLKVLLDGKFWEEIEKVL